MSKSIKAINRKCYHQKSLLIFTIMLFCAMLILSGCDMIPGGGKGPIIKKFKTGYDGVTITPYKSNPKEVYEGDDFPMAAFVKNIGSYNVNSTGPIKLSVTYNDYYLTLSSRIEKRESYSFVLHGKDPYYPLGEEDFFEFYFESKKLDSLREKIETDITFNLCYPYASEFGISTCIDTRTTLQETIPSPCTKSDYIDKSGQGAPVAVVKIVPDFLIVDKNTVRPQFRIYLENKGDGYVVYPTKADVCADPNILNSTNINKVRVLAWLSDRELECSPNEVNVFDGAENIAICKVKNESLEGYKRNQRNYVAPLAVRVEYGYIEVYNEKINIHRLEGVAPDSVIICGAYEVKTESGCISKCAYCADPQNTNKEECKTGVGNYNIKPGFACTCTKATCEKLDDSGRCGFGFCPGSNYCCDTDSCLNKPDGTVCANNYVCFGGRCGGQNKTLTECWWKKGQFDGNYTCMTNTKCNSTTIITKLCPDEIDNVCCRPK